MLVNQGVIGVKYWTGVDVDPSVMKRKLEEIFSPASRPQFLRIVVGEFNDMRAGKAFACRQVCNFDFVPSSLCNINARNACSCSKWVSALNW
jgi:hypothetical protein